MSLWLRGKAFSLLDNIGNVEVIQGLFLSGQLFVFINRRRNQCKVLYFERDGYCIWCKRLEQGQFHSHAGHAVKQLLAFNDLKLMIDGIDTRSLRYHKRYVNPDLSISKKTE